MKDLEYRTNPDCNEHKPIRTRKDNSVRESVVVGRNNYRDIRSMSIPHWDKDECVMVWYLR